MTIIHQGILRKEKQAMVYLLPYEAVELIRNFSTNDSMNVVLPLVGLAY